MRWLRIPTMRPRSARDERGGRLRRLLADTRAATAVEFAIVSMPFMALLGAIFESAVIFLATQVLDTATYDAARLIRTGQAQAASYSASTFKTQVCNRLYVMFDCAGVSVESTVYTSFSSFSNSMPLDTDGNYDATKVTNFNMGNAQDIVVVRVFYAYPVFFNRLPIKFDLSNTTDGKRLLVGVAAFRNEPFPW